MKKYLAEMIGTMVLVLMGCGAAVSLGCDPVNNQAAVVGTAIAFGLSVVAMAYTIGGISGCHINPAITLGVFLSGRMSAKDCVMYMLFQFIGGLIGAALLFLLVTNAGSSFAAAGAGLGANGLQEGDKCRKWPTCRDYLYMRIRTCSIGCNVKDQWYNR